MLRLRTSEFHNQRVHQTPFIIESIRGSNFFFQIEI